MFDESKVNIIPSTPGLETASLSLKLRILRDLNELAIVVFVAVSFSRSFCNTMSSKSDERKPRWLLLLLLLSLLFVLLFFVNDCCLDGLFIASLEGER